MSMFFWFMAVVAPEAINNTISRESIRNTHNNRLLDKLLFKYDRLVPPPPNPTSNRGVNVTIYLWPYDIMDVDVQRSAITISGWIDMRWTDRNLVWNPADFNNITEVFIQRDQLWLPEIDIFYSKGNEPPSRTICGHCPVRVTHEGRILRGYYFSYSFPCEVNVRMFPYDQHKCEMQIANWHMDDRFMDLWPESRTIDMSTFLKNEEWSLEQMQVSRQRYKYNYGHFPVLLYTMIIKRKPFTYVLNQVAPCISLTVTAIIGFHMPNSGTGVHGDKVKMGMTSILAILILELAVANKLPKVSDVIPLIVVFYGMMMIMLALAIISTSGIIMVEKQAIYGSKVPKWARFIFRLKNHKVAPSTSVASATRRNCQSGCKLNQRNKMNTIQLLIKQGMCEPVKPLGRAGNSQGHTSATTMAMVEAVQNLRNMFQASRESMEAEKLKALNQRDWQVLADKLETVSMISFLGLCALSTYAFFYADHWYTGGAPPLIEQPTESNTTAALVFWR